MAGNRISAERSPWPLSADTRRDLAGSPADTAVLDEARLPPALGLRHRRPGDRFRPLGLEGTKKLQDFFVDRKVPRGDRDAVPLIVDDRDRIVWVAGYAVAEDFRVTDHTRAVVILKLRPRRTTS